MDEMLFERMYSQLEELPGVWIQYNKESHMWYVGMVYFGYKIATESTALWDAINLTYQKWRNYEHA